MTYVVEQTLTGKTVLEETLIGKISEGTGFISPQSKEVIPDTEVQNVTPDGGYDCLSEVNVKAVPYEEIQNEAGGTTVKIG